MDRPGDHLLARARFPQKQHRTGQGGHLLNQLHDPLQAEIGPDNLLSGHAPQPAVEELVVVGQELLNPGQIPVPQAVGQGHRKPPPGGFALIRFCSSGPARADPSKENDDEYIASQFQPVGDFFQL